MRRLLGRGKPDLRVLLLCRRCGRATWRDAGKPSTCPCGAAAEPDRSMGRPPRG